jgi:hypothetical protein
MGIGKPDRAAIGRNSAAIFYSLSTACGTRTTKLLEAPEA